MNAPANNLSSNLRKTESGFTLIELMVTIAVLAIIVGIAAPNISTQLANQRVKSTAATLENALSEAKAESVIRRQAQAVSYTNGTTDAGTITIGSLKTYRYDAKSTINGVTGSITFNPSKIASVAATYKVCDSNTNATARQVSVSKLAVISNQAGGTCP
ncbi:pilus assembly FimT family protein [Psychrobacter namhaensis]|uniref:pilus assembly FimT family protein n=1 Tax=Psychrobacter namhaensis TaxID=292734 RepID=UPI001D1300F3|nr:prepilin-type N-terminal cleavage/methylation domain-containing protein [Psychrobacter namhaensis]